MNTRIFLSLFLSFFPLFGSLWAQDATTQIDKYLEGLVEKGQFSGRVFISMNGVQLSKGYGRSRFPDGPKPDEQTTFKVGSITKQFTGFAILDLAEKKLLALEDPISEFFPEVDPSVFMKDGKSVTITDLLTHKSGIPDVSGLVYHWGSPVRFAWFLKLLEMVSDRDPPGAVYQYSNLNFFLLGEIITRVTRLPYADYVQAHYFNPLEMASTAMTFQDPTRRAFGHNTIRGKLIPSDEVHDFLYHGTYDWPQASDGGLVSTISDLKVWVDHLASQKVYFSRYQSHWREKGYFAGLINIGTQDKPVYWHNGALSPIGYNSDLLFDTSGNKIIVLSNVNMQTVIPNLASRIHGFLEKGEPLQDLPSFHSNAAFLNLILSKIKLGLLMSVAGMILLYRKRNEPNFGLTSYSYFGSAVLVNSFGIQKLESLVMLAVMLVFWIGIFLRRKPSAEAVPFKMVRLVSPTLALVIGLLYIYNRI